LSMEMKLSILSHSLLKHKLYSIANENNVQDLEENMFDEYI